MEEISKIDMIIYLRKRGWRPLWSEDNWIDGNRVYSNPDWAGTSLDKAYQYVKENEHLYIEED